MPINTVHLVWRELKPLKSLMQSVLPFSAYPGLEDLSTMISAYLIWDSGDDLVNVFL